LSQQLIEYLDQHLEIVMRYEIEVISFVVKFRYSLRQKKLLQISHCEVSIYMQQHSNSTCIWSICLSVDSIFQSLWFLSWFFRDREWLLTRKLLFHGRHHDLANSYVLSVSCCFTVATMTWLTVTYYLCPAVSRSPPWPG
jgi:hypothetical protein